MKEKEQKQHLKRKITCSLSLKLPNSVFMCLINVSYYHCQYYCFSYSCEKFILLTISLDPNLLGHLFIKELMFLRFLSSCSSTSLCFIMLYYGNPLQYSCLENPVDRGALWAAVHRVA
ncbi:unnamed protein product [Rangifer tarandus platyrhynchus]|uniref:Uncharacterized protein n=2 Tax=Rangifer tarandus platyrhynchus TaxID=3082113 RepID=A0ABN8ZZ05_RANTA|nr:unnamed protein product [Rangifer tarandus platyrhynchus]